MTKNKDNIIKPEFTKNGPHTKDTVIDYLAKHRDIIVSVTSVVEFHDGRVGVYADDKDIYTWLFQKAFLDSFINRAFDDRVQEYTEE
tara:strand:+ start:666 stop:926 length:261 start_codon:yes stop_codon:yes gene_type:complete